MGERSGRLDTDQAEWTATVQRLQGMVQHLRTKHESEEAVVAELRARVQNAEGAFEAAWNVIARLETDIAGLRRQLTFPAGDNATREGPLSAGKGNRTRFDEEGFFATPKGRGHGG